MLPPTAAGSDQVGTKDFEFDVSADAARQIQAQIDGVDGDDYDLYLYKGTKSADNVVASSTSETADETIAYDYPAARPLHPLGAELAGDGRLDRHAQGLRLGARVPR